MLLRHPEDRKDEGSSEVLWLVNSKNASLERAARPIETSRVVYHWLLDIANDY